MSLVSRTIPGLYNGVSQQPATLRLPSQAEAVVNAYATVADGLRKRPPMEHVANISVTPLTSAFIHTINRDTSERYVVVVEDGDIKVFDADGTAKAVNFPLADPVGPPVVTGKEYLDIPAESTAAESFAIVSIADYSFVVNKTKIVASKAAPAAEPEDRQYWHLPAVWYTLPNIAAIIARFFNALQDPPIGTKQTFSDLPKPGDVDAPNEGDVWKIAGLDQGSFGAYYVVRRSGVWEETHGPDASTTLDEATMPHALVREADGTFSFTPFGWVVRKVGDEVSNPLPSFVGSTIQDVFYHKNRLGFASQENVVFSGAGDFGNFWRNTVTDLLDADVVDVAVSSTKVSLIQFAVAFNNNLMLFADQTQFSLNVDDILTPKSVSIDAVTNYEMSTRVRPAPVGKDVYFVTESGNYSRIREYFVDDGESNSADASDITAHVPRFVPKGVTKLTGNANEDVLFALSEDEPNRVYVYRFYWNPEGKVQSSWSYWELPLSSDVILNIEVLDNELYLVIQRVDGVFIEKCDVQSGATTGDLDEQVLLDRLTSITGTYLSGSDETEFDLPYEVLPINQPGFQMVRGSDFTDEVLSLVDPSQYEWVDQTTIRVPGNHADGEVWIGQSYTMRYTFSEQFMLAGDKAITTGRLMLRTFVIYFTHTAYFATEVSPYGTDPLIEEIVPVGLSEFTGKTLGAESLVLGEPAYHTGRYAFQIHGDSKVAKVSLLNDSHVQSTFQQAEFEGFWFNRARSL